MHTAPAQGSDVQVASDTLQQRHDLMIELYRLDQADMLARRQERNEELHRIEHARQRVNDLLTHLAG